MFNIAKTELIHFTAKKERKERSLQLPDNTIVELKDTIKWLGIYIDNRLSFKEHIATRVSQATKAFHRLGRLANIERGLSPKAVRQLYLACVTSVADYGSQIYWKNQSYATSLLQSLHNLACRKIIRVFRTSPSLPTSIKSRLTSPAIRLNTNNRNELEGIAQAFEHAAIVAQEGQEIYVYADNQAAIYRLNNLSDNLGQQWLLRCIRAAKRITTKKASIHLQWAPGHNDVKGNEKADTLAKEAAKERPTTSTTASLAYLGTEINKIQKTE
ncbi:hypothetical protein PtrM4_029180 [Pyrenophora tritici-repentis]|uniref:RNase H type-1 domain-containing protein n=1 Tax=Pyrenophora tritici-repentis TaxID=45151 RepID=A0A834VWV3_9PLEO|nr:hypothetical protein PtrM4_029180 [Pyrenophora tritici-repentis]